MNRRSFIQKTGFAGIILLADPKGAFSPEPDELESGFLNPPSSAYPYAYWFWMNGNISREGITLDLEAMKNTGIGGVFNFDVGTGIPEGPVEYLSEAWCNLKQHAIEEAARLGLEFTMHNCPGFSASGGPWITPELAMQQITWSESYIQGGKPVDYTLPKPNSKLNYYKDIAVLAFPSLKEEKLMKSVKAYTNSGPQDTALLSNGKGIITQPVRNEKAWLQFKFTQPFEVRMVTFFVAAIPGQQTDKQPETGERTHVTLEASQDGINFREVAKINTGVESELMAGDKYIVYGIPVYKAKYYRISSTKARRYRQVIFSGITRLNEWMEKTNMRPRNITRVDHSSAIDITNDQQVPADSILPLNSITDISEFVTNGLLQWNPPAGDWTIVRVGYTPTGAMIQAAPDKGGGLECDKFNAAAMTFHFEKMMGPLLPVIKPLTASKKFGLEIDSYEAGSQNWSAGFEKEFEKRCGYNLIKYLPILAGGRIIGNVDITERFTWDLRRVQATLMAENYYGRFYELCKENNIISYVEPYDSGPMEEMQIGAKADIPVGEFWSGISTAFAVNNPVKRTPKLASSIAHINGRKIAGAEAFTAEPDASRWQEYPFSLKALGDKAFTQGINRMVLHRFAHQPHPTAAPGMTMGPWGSHFDRTNTWWNAGAAWFKYLQRCQFLLQQGKPVADLLYFTGEDANMYTRALPGQLFGYPYEFNYDLVNATVILNDITIKNNRIFLPNGTSYALLVLQDYRAVSLRLLRRLRSLVQEGMILVGRKPERSAGMNSEDTTFQQIANEIWGKITGKSITINYLGEGRVYGARPIPDILKDLQIVPDFKCTHASAESNIQYVHRKLGDTDIYFISNQRRQYADINGSFRIKNKTPELWDPATGQITKAPAFKIDNDGIHLPLQLEPCGSMFVIFRKTAAYKQLHSVVKDQATIFDVKPFEQYVYDVASASSGFTFSFWVKPEINILLQNDFAPDSKAPLWTEYHAIAPEYDSLIGKGQAVCGLTIGRNGIAVWENSWKTPYMVLSVPVPIEGWTHIAFRYKNNTPAIFVNGKLVKQGAKSKYMMHPPVSTRQVPDYNGDLIDADFHPKALDETAIAVLSKTKRTFLQSPYIIEPAYGDKPALMIKENGNYEFNYGDGNKIKFSIGDLHQKFEIKTPWTVAFPKNSGAPSQIILPDLISLHHHAENGVKYFSGTASYTNQFFIPKNSITGKNWFIDLGEVNVIAEIFINGKSLGILWKRPYQTEVTNAIAEGENSLLVNVTNLWTNRLIGDEQLPDPDKFTPGGGNSGIPGITGGGIEKLPDWYIQGKIKPNDGRIAFTTWKHYTRNSPLTESGLIGPVTIWQAVTKPV